ncbi:MAG: hypothetical protein M1816_007943 [Peltula sp. TS41687]|nr:MAG: hypothetical protein M1816_007943 [Peltula sp. TS41687]
MKRTSSTDDGRVSPPPIRRKVQSSISKNAVANFFTPASLRPPEKTRWQIIQDSLLIARHFDGKLGKDAVTLTGPQKIAAFDLDSTLIRTASGNQHAKMEGDWKWWDPIVPSTLKELHDTGYKLVIMSNQAGIRLKPDPKSVKGDLKRLSVFKGKVSAILDHLDLPISLYAATGQDQYRKPRTGMWEEMLKDYGLLEARQVDTAGSFYVGDAGGRSGVPGTRNDFACSDRNLAENLKIAFHTPEEFFLKHSPRSYTPGFDPKSYLNSVLASSPVFAPTLFSKRNKLDVVLLCGSPGAGKSTFYWKLLEPLGYERVNQDLLKTRERCFQVASENLLKGRSVAIDNTNADPETRAKWVELAGRHNVPIRCLYFTASAELCCHNNVVRALNGDIMNPENRELLPNVAFASFASRFRAPTLDEGFQDLVKIDFQFAGNDEQRAIWSKHWI